MKKIILPLVMLALVSFGVTDTKLTDVERKLAITEMNNSSDHLLKAIKGLSAAQLNYKSGEGSWSVAECTEHIAISENNIFGMLEGALKTAADPSKRADVKVSDEALMAMIVDRTNKVKTQESFEPSGKFGTHEKTVSAFLEKRKANIKFVKETQEDLRNRYQQLPFGTIDAFQILLFMSAHTERHVRQIEEIMAGEGFPKK